MSARAGREDYRGRRVTVVGLGRSGFAAAKFLAERGARVRATDASSKSAVVENAGFLGALGVETETGRHTSASVDGAEWLVASPGVPKDSLPLVLARERGIPVISEIELAARSCRGTILGITGTNGKTTTSHLTYHVLSACGKKAVLCGNVGYSFLGALPEIDESTHVVLELSSFQLEDSPTFRPRLGAILNLSPNHLDRHGTMERYAEAKANLFRNQKASDSLVLGHDDLAVRLMGGRARSRVFYFGLSPLERGIFVHKGAACWRQGRTTRRLFGLSGLPLDGEHNLRNVLAASALAILSGCRPEAVRGALRTFRPLEHRIEPLGTLRGVRFVNDSKSTTVESTRAAIQACRGRVVLVAGGRDKGAPFAEIENELTDKVSRAVLYGEAAPKIAACWKGWNRHEIVRDFRQAVRVAFARCRPGETLLLSPMCASFDQFASFEERGETFRKLYAELAAETGAEEGAGWKR